MKTETIVVKREVEETWTVRVDGAGVSFFTAGVTGCHRYYGKHFPEYEDTPAEVTAACERLWEQIRPLQSGTSPDGSPWGEVRPKAEDTSWPKSAYDELTQLQATIRDLRADRDAFEKRAVEAERHRLAVAQAVGVVYEGDGFAPQPGPDSNVLAWLKGSHERDMHLADMQFIATELREKLAAETKRADDLNRRLLIALSALSALRGES